MSSLLLVAALLGADPGHWPLYTNPRLPLGRAGGPAPAYPAAAPRLHYMPVEVEAPPVRVGPAQVIIIVPEVRVRASEVTIDPPQVRFEDAEPPKPTTSSEPVSAPPTP